MGGAAPTPSSDDAWRAVVLDESVPADVAVVRDLRADPAITVVDRRAAQEADLAATRSPARSPSTAWAFLMRVVARLQLAFRPVPR